MHSKIDLYKQLPPYPGNSLTLHLDNIKKLSGKALHALMRFFGFEIDNATSKGPAIIFAKMV